VSEEGLESQRAQIEALEKDLKKVTTERDEFSGKLRLYEAKEAFTNAELNPALAKLFVAADPTAEISVEAAKAFAEDYGVADLGTPAPAPVEDAAPQPTAPADNPNLNLMGRAGSRGGEGGQQAAGTKALTVQEYQALVRTDAVAAAKAVAEGRVKLNDSNGWAKDRPDMTGSNPYAPAHQAQE
jgi:hypothetical protein